MSDHIRCLTASHSPVFLVNSRQSHFTAAHGSFGREGLHRQGHPLFRSYGASLPSSFARVISSTLGSSPRLPVSVLVRIPVGSIEVFLGSLIRISWRTRRIVSPLRLGVVRPRICLRSPPTRLDQHDQRLADLSLLRHPELHRFPGSTGILTCLPSPTPLGLGLGSDLP